MMESTQNHSAEPSKPAPAGQGTPAPAGKSNPVAEQLSRDIREYVKVAEEVRGRLNPSLPDALKRKQIVDCAAELFGVAPTWVAFFREVLGKECISRQLFTSEESYAEFCMSPEYTQLLEMLTALRSRDLPENDPTESQRMITVRIPVSLHEAICDEANRLKVSVNKLCISRLVQRLDRSMIPTSQQKRRGRKPGAAANRVSNRTKSEDQATGEHSQTPGQQSQPVTQPMHRPAPQPAPQQPQTSFGQPQQTPSMPRYSQPKPGGFQQPGYPQPGSPHYRRGN